jgi:dipeptidyl aminopeptidase/acylaminoacyl peptidase
MICIRISLLALGFACIGGAAPAQTKQTLTHEVLWSFHRVGAPVPSPDGKWVVFAVTEPSYDPANEVADLWIVPADGRAQPRRLTSNKAGESGPAWSRDGARLAFAAKRDDDEVAQIYVLDVALGGDAHRVTNAPTAASAPVWSPDGTRIAFQAAMWQGATDEESNRKAAQDKRNAKSKVRAYEAFPIRNFDRWLDESKTHLWIVDVATPPSPDRAAGTPAATPPRPDRAAGTPAGDRKARSVLAGTKLAALAGFGGDALGAAWAPDGQSIVFVATDHRDVAARGAVTSALWQVPAAGGEPARLPAEGWDMGVPRFRPDGKGICFSGSDARVAIYTVPRLGCATWPWSAGSVTVMAKELDRPVGSWAFAPDSRTIYFTAEDAGHERVYSVPAAGGPATLVMDAPQGVYTGLQVPQRGPAPVLFANWETAVNPAEIVRIDPATKTREFLTAFNTERAASIDWQPLRDFWFTGRGGRRIHSYIALPPNFDPSKKYPLFVLLHGGHASSWRDSISYRWNYHLLTHPGFVLLATDYRGSTGYGEPFTLDILGDPLKGPADDINDAADEAIKRFAFIDGTRQAAGGASYGGHLANWLEGTTSRYKAIVSHAGLASLDMQWGTSDGIYHRELMMGGPYWENPQKWIEQSPLAKGSRFKTPMLLSVGENDFRVPEGNTLAMYSALQRMNVPARLLIWPDENHWILKGENSRVFYREVRAWLEKYVIPASAGSQHP